jgi:prepilin-type N-terminal cleavage/methylation domain-containing protein
VLTTMRNHRGYTLVELLVVMVIMVTVTGGILKLLNTSQRLSRAQAERVDLQSNVRIASIVVPGELRELNNVSGVAVLPSPQVDILSMQPTSIRYRAMRGIGYVCAGATVTQIRLSDFSGYRTTVPVRDAAYIFVDGDENTGDDDGWVPAAITGVAADNSCGEPTVTLTVPGGALVTVPPVGTPVRTYEVMELSLYADAGKSWLGARSVSANELSPRPLLGPLNDGDGLSLSYLNSAGGNAAIASDVKSIVLTVRGVTSQQISTGGGNAHSGYVRDSLVSQVSLRNAFRP